MFRRNFLALTSLLFTKPIEKIYLIGVGVDRTEFDAAMDRNIVFYDQTAMSGCISYRLKALMNEALIDNEDTYWKDKDMGHVVKFIDCGPDIISYYKKSCCTFPSGDANLLLAVTSTGKYILGSY